jgi:hypothetical protein
MFDDNVNALKIIGKGLQKELEKIEKDLEDSFPKPKVQVPEIYEDLKTRINGNKKTDSQTKLENRRDEIKRELEAVRKRIELQEKGI